MVQEACIREVCAPKPGNVSRHHDFTDACFEDFLLSAVAIGPAFEKSGHSSVGRTILHAVNDSRKLVGNNTNLGIILLLAPLAKACLVDIGKPMEDIGKIRKDLGDVLGALTVEDARLAYEAIRAANPGGLGRAAAQDVSEEPSMTLLEAMDLAKDRDSIASEYITGFEITFGTALPALKDALARGVTCSDAVVQAFLTILGRVPDSLVARKNGVEVSRQVSNSAQEVLLQGGVFTPQGRAKLQEMDRALRDEAHKLNPGTTADLTAAAIFLALLEEETGLE
ncbi:MAG: triphosphoribosyl-dephospho-CoA synthase [Acidobacteria bacterium]|nr:triphosphoribosyl-dephospho-CoA synthase [Acidobacteriota bacterium]